MLVAHDPIPFYNEKLMLYFTFCFDVDLIYKNSKFKTNLKDYELPALSYVLKLK